MTSEPKLTDLSFLEEFTKGNANKMNRYIEMYLKTAPAVVDEFQLHLDRKNYEDLRLQAHSIKPQAQYMGIVSLKECLINIENKVKSGGSEEDLRELIHKAQNISAKAKVELKEFLSKTQ